MNARSSAAWISVAACLLVGLVAFAPTRAAAKGPALRIAGSDSMASMLRAIATEYQARNPGFLYELDSRGSATAPPLLLRGDVEIAAMTRELNTLEQRAFRARYGRLPTRVPVAVDAVAIVVNEANPADRLNLQQVDAIFSATRVCGERGGEIRSWGDVGGTQWASRQIGVLVMPRTSGTRAYFEQRALCGGTFRADARELPGARSILRALIESPESIGYASRSALTGTAKALPLEGRFGRLYAATSSEDVRSGKYPLTRSLFLYAVAESDEPSKADLAPRAPSPARRFIAFVLSEAGQEIVEREGFLPLAPEDVATQRARFE